LSACDERSVSTPDQQGQADEADFRSGADDEFLIEGFRLLIIDEDEEGVAPEGLDCFLELGLPVDLSMFLQAILRPACIEDGLRFRRLNKPPKRRLSRPLIEVLNFLIDPLANQFANGDALGGKFELSPLSYGMANTDRGSLPGVVIFTKEQLRQKFPQVLLLTGSEF